jgi:hypothetical protein
MLNIILHMSRVGETELHIEFWWVSALGITHKNDREGDERVIVNVNVTWAGLAQDLCNIRCELLSSLEFIVRLIHFSLSVSIIELVNLYVNSTRINEAHCKLI